MLSIGKISDIMEENKEDAHIPLPMHTTFLKHQIAGHKHGQGTSMLGVLKHKDGSILKPLLDNDSRAERELSFYENVLGECESDPTISELASFLPLYYGTWIGEMNGKYVNYLRLEDVTDKFKVPCNLDIKIGAITYDPLASKTKIEYERIKYPDALVLGFRILGMKVFDESKQNFFVLNKSYGKQQTAETIVNALHLYLNKDNTCIASIILSGFIHRLKKIENWFCVQKRFAFYASSLLFVYEGDSSKWLSWLNDLANTSLLIEQHLESKSNYLCFSESTPLNTQLDFTCSENRHILLDHISSMLLQKNVCSICGLNSIICNKIQSDCPNFDVRMIDFAHIFPSNQEDNNYLFGLRNFLQYLETLHKKILH